MDHLNRVILGLFWVGLGFAKMADPSDWEETVGQTGGTNVLPGAAIVTLFTAVEMALGLGLLLGVFVGRLAAGTAWASLIVATLLVALAWWFPSARTCGCFGALGAAQRGQRVMVAAGLVYFSVCCVRAGIRPSSHGIPGPACGRSA